MTGRAEAVTPHAKMLAFGAGPWVDEQDLTEFEHAGLQCVVIRMMPIGHLCGYVRVPHGHIVHGMGYDDVDDVFDDGQCLVHGGFTYAKSNDPRTFEDDADGGWWVGFDAAHAGDLMPKMSKTLPGLGIYRDVAYMTQKCMNLADALSRANPK